jgi:hypothetical protein
MRTKIDFYRPTLYPAQLAAIFHNKRFGVVEASTKAGKTFACLVWLFELFLVFGEAGWNYWWVAPSYPQARIAYRRLRRAINRLPMATRSLFKFNESELTCVGPDGQVLTFRTGEKPDLLYGDDVHACVIDEYTRVREEAWFAVLSTLTKTNGLVRLIGNVKGRKNWGYALARKAEAGERGWHYAKLTADDAVKAGVIKPEVVEDARRTLPPDVFRELFYAEPAENRANPFGSDNIAACTAPLTDEDVVAWGVDLAKSLDFTVLFGLDANGYTGRNGFHEWQKPWEECEEDILSIVGDTDAMVDESGVGNPIVERLQRRGENFHGFNFAGSSKNIGGMGKQQLMEFFRAKVRQHEIRFPPEVAAQMMEFEYEYTRTGVKYSAPEGMHDDRVIACALATLMWDSLGYGSVGRALPGTLDAPPSKKELADAIKQEMAYRQAAMADEMRLRGLG